MSGASEFGKDLGLLHEVVVTGRKAGWGSTEWAKIAHDIELMQRLLPVLQGRAEVVRSRLILPAAITLPAIKKPARLASRQGVQLSKNTVKLFGAVKTLSDLPERQIGKVDLAEPMSDPEIIAVGGGREVVVFKLALLEVTLFRLMDMADHGMPWLLTDGSSNIFYVEDADNQNRVLYVRVLYGVGWHVHSGEVTAAKWSPGYRCFQATARQT